MKANVLPTVKSYRQRTVLAMRISSSHLSQTASPLMTSPTLPPELRYVTLMSVETPVEYSPRDARTNDPPRSVMDAIVPPWRMLRRLVWCFSMGSSKETLPGDAAVIRSYEDIN